MESNEDLSDLERRLSQMQPTSTALSRERMLFLAGSAAANNQRRTHWGWPAATTALSLTVLGLGVLLGQERSRNASLANDVSASRPYVMLQRQDESPAPAQEDPTREKMSFAYLSLRNQMIETGVDSHRSSTSISTEPGEGKRATRASDRMLFRDKFNEI